MVDKVCMGSMSIDDLDEWWTKYVWVQCQLMICRGHIGASKGALQILLWLTVLWKN